MSVYDFENLCDDIKGILTDHLNTKIASINTEKNDGITLPTVDSDAYFFQSLNGKQVNHNPFILYGVQDIQGEGMYGQTPSQLEIAVVLCLEDDGSVSDIDRKIFRFGRALKEVFEEHFEDIPHRVKLSVQSQVPVEYKLLNTSYNHRVVGVLLRADMG